MIDEFVVYSVDDKGKPSEEPVEVIKMQGPKGPVRVEIAPAGDGTFKIEDDIDNLSPGDYTVQVLDESGQPSKTIEFQIGNIAEPKSSFTKGPDVEELTIYTRGADGKPGEGICTVEMEGPDGPIEIKLEEVPDEKGTYRAAYTPMNFSPDGDYFMDVMVNGEPISKICARPTSSKPGVKGCDSVLYSSG